MRHFIAAFIFFGAGFAACQVSPELSLSTGDPVDFAEARIILERNVTDEDAEIVVTAKGLDEGLERLKIVGPSGAVLADLTAGASTLGVREIAIESPEPGMDRVRAAYPEGAYRLEGRTFSGVRLRSIVTLSHRLPEPPEIRVDLETGTIHWTPVAAAAYAVELEREVDDVDEATVSMQLPRETTSFRIPALFRGPGEYQIGVAAIGENGNVTVVEKSFSIAE